MAQSHPTTKPYWFNSKTEFAPNHPAVIGEAFAAYLLGAPTLPDGVDELNPIGVDDAKDRRSGQEGLRPVLMGLEEAEEPGALGEAGKQGSRVARQPAMERPVPHAFERMQHPQGDHLTGPEVRLSGYLGRSCSCSSTW